MKHLTIKLKEIHCKDPQDPKRDELYFITATNDTNNVTKAVRKIKRGEKRSYDELTDEQRILFDREFNELSPVVLTAMEQRAAQDNSAIAEQLEAAANMGLKIVNRRIEEGMSDKSDLSKIIVRLLMKHVVNLFKEVFKDSALGHKVIPPFSEDEDNQVEYVLVAESKEPPTYKYVITLEVTVS